MAFTQDQTISISYQKPANYNMITGTYRTLKLGVWAYFLLLIFEGALRKWVLPGLATPLLLIRDPVAIGLLIMSIHRGIVKPNYYMISMVIIGIISINTAFLFGHGSIPVAFYGARAILFHFPFIFVIGKVFNRANVITLGKIMLWLSIPMTLLIAVQFYSPQSAWINRGIGGDTAGAGFSGALGYFRPPGTFSFTNGNTLFYGLLASFVFYFWLDPKQANRILLLSATAALLIAIPLSISRGLFFQTGVAFVFAIVAASRKPQYFSKMIFAVVAAIIAFIILSKTNFFHTGTQAFTSRFETASDQEGGVKGSLGGRYLGGLINELFSSINQPFFGYGSGMGTNVGSTLLVGNQGYLIAEGEWGRLIGELGPLLGLWVIYLRTSLTVRLAIASYKRLVSSDLLPWFLLSFAALALPQGQWAQPTALGFSILIGGLMIASFNQSGKEQA